MVYVLSKSFLRKTKAKIIIVSGLLFSLGFLSLYTLFNDFDAKAIIGLLFLWMGYKKSQELKYWKERHDKIYLQVTSDKISITDGLENRQLMVNEVSKVVLQPIHGKVKSIILHSSTGELTKIQGIDSMHNLTEQFKGLFDESTIKIARMFHR